jgi:hypothetical protein
MYIIWCLLHTTLHQQVDGVRTEYQYRQHIGLRVGAGGEIQVVSCILGSSREDGQVELSVVDSSTATVTDSKIVSMHLGACRQTTETLVTIRNSTVGSIMFHGGTRATVVDSVLDSCISGYGGGDVELRNCSGDLSFDIFPDSYVHIHDCNFSKPVPRLPNN